MNKWLFLIIGLLVLAFASVWYFKGDRYKASNNCLECHSQVLDNDALSVKARGKSQLIFYHRTHMGKGIKLRCLDCHGDGDPHQGARPLEHRCLECHTGAAKEPSNDCEFCHANDEALRF